MTRTLQYTLSAFLIAAALAGQTAPVTLTAPNMPRKRVSADGFLQRWLLLEPIPTAGLTDSAVRAAIQKEYFPKQLEVLPRDGDKVTVGDKPLTWHAVDTVNYNVNLYHFAHGLGLKTSDVLFWAVIIVESPREMPNVRLAIGSNAASVWWLNGQETIRIFGDRQTVIDDGVSKRLTLRKGTNVLRAAIINGGGATDFCARFLDENDRPIRDLTASLPAAP